MPFLLPEHRHRPALMDDAGGSWITYAEVADRAEAWQRRLQGPRGLVLAFVRNDVDSVAAMLGTMAAGHPLALFGADLGKAARDALVAAYQPDWLIDAGQSDDLAPRLTTPETPLHPDLALLLSTSGSTGSPKLVRLSLPAITANAVAVADVLSVTADDVAAGYLPLHYSYGLSVLTSHLIRGARVRLTAAGLTDRQFWPAMREAAVTHFPGVPFHYQILAKLGLARLKLDSVRTMTQAGGALDVATRRLLHAHMDARGGRFHVLYGQTEAAPRMTTLVHEEFPEAPESVGKALAGCSITIRDPDQSGVGEVVFAGPNVMMGYAQRRADLALGDTQGGQLATGDMGRLDDAGRLHLSGRSKRFGKLFGLRINLDELETLAQTLTDAAVTMQGEQIIVHAVSAGSEQDNARLAEQLVELFSGRFTIPRTAYVVRPVTALARTERGKIDYQALDADR